MNNYLCLCVCIISEGPTSVSLAVKPATLLPNGTLYVKQGLDVYFNCSSESFPSQNLTWTVEDVALDGYERASGNKSFLDFSIRNIQPSDQGMYTCTSQNTLSKTTVNKSQELLVYCKADAFIVFEKSIANRHSYKFLLYLVLSVYFENHCQCRFCCVW